MRAILQVADTGPLESLVVMLRAVGYECLTPSEQLKCELRRIGLDTVLDREGLVKGMGYERGMSLPLAFPQDMDASDVLYVDIKAHRNGPKVWERWPHLRNKTLWYRINGGKPEHVIKADGTDCGDEVNPPCPVLTPNLWYLEDVGRAYACWPPFYRIGDYYDRYGRHGFSDGYQPPLCLIHNLVGWGYGALVDSMRALGVRCYGNGSPDGLVQHTDIPQMLSKAKCMVHLKSSDAPGYAIYEALAAGCPLVVTRRLIWRCRMETLLIPGETCLVFDRETHDGLSQDDVHVCTQEVRKALQQLSDPGENRRIGLNGLEQLKKVAWSKHKPDDVASLTKFMEQFQ